MPNKNIKKRVKTIFSIVLICFFVFLLTVNYFQIIVYSASGVNSHGVTGLAASNSNGTWTSNPGVISGSAKTTAKDGCTGTTYTNTTATLTLKNNTSNDCMLSFNWEIELNGGTCSVNGTNTTSNGMFSLRVNASQSITISIVSSTTAANTTTITLTNISLTQIVENIVTFLPATNGSYKIDGSTINANTPITKNSSEVSSFELSPSNGYKLLYWEQIINNTTNYLSRNITEISYLDTCTIKPVFCSSSLPIFKVGSRYYNDLEVAIQYASSNSIDRIILIDSGTLSSGTYTIPNGITLLIPFDDAYTMYTTTPEVIYGSHKTPSQYVRLTMQAGASIVVQSGGRISVSSKLCATGTGSGSWNGTPTGKHGRIDMNMNSSIILNSGAALYCYGYISGSGTVTANSGSTVYETMQFRCWRGGSCTTNSTFESKKVFPMSQYYVQNIEAHLVIKGGATEKVYTSVNASSTAYPASATFIGSDGMFRVQSDGQIEKYYDGSTDRVIYNISGTGTISSLSLTIPTGSIIGNYNLDTSSYVLPIQNNITINILSGTTTVSQDLAMLPSTQLHVYSGATININSNVYVYDVDQWGFYAADSQKIVVVGYSTVNGITAVRVPDDLEDALMDVNGTINLQSSGKLYTTSSGASIISSQGTGIINYNSAAGTATTTYQVTQSGTTPTAVDIPITSAKLKNDDGSYVETTGTSSGSFYKYCEIHKKWEQKQTYNLITFIDGTSSISKRICGQATDVSLFNDYSVNRSNYSFVGWNTSQNFDGTLYTINDTITVSSNISLYAEWKCTIIFDGNGGTLNTTSTDVFYGQSSVSQIINPTKSGAMFGGWSTDGGLLIITSDGHLASNKYPYTDVSGKWIYSGGGITLYAIWSEDSYTITFYNDDGTETLYIQSNAPYGEEPVYGGSAPQKSSTIEYDYTFIGWTDEIGIVSGLKIVTGNADYYAVFSQTIRNYTITFDTGGGTPISPIVQPYGSIVTAPNNPTREGYTFVNWDIDIPSTMPAENLTITANWSIVTYTIEFKFADGTTIYSNTFSYNTQIVYAGPLISDQNSTNDGVDRFIGWNEDKNSLSAITNDALPNATEDCVYYAIFTHLTKIAVVFNSNGGTSVATQYLINSIGYGEYVSKPVNPTKTECDFEGWYSDNSFNTLFDFDIIITDYYSLISDGVITLYAKWSAHTFAIFYKDQGNNSFSGVHGSNYPTSHTYGTDTTLVSPSKEGYTFNGWFIQRDCSGTEITVLGGTDYTDSITLYAKWTINSYTIYYDLNGGNYDITPPNSYTYSTSEQSINIGTATKDGCMGYVSTNVGTINNGILTILANTTGDITITWTWKIIVNKPAADNTVYTYNGLEQTYQIASNSGYVVTNDKRTDAGSQNVTVTLNGGYIWNTGTEEVLSNYVFTIQKAALIVTANDNPIIYGDAPSSSGYTITGFVNNENEGVLTGTVTYSYNYSQYGNVGSYNIIPTGLSSDNYNISYVNGTLTVNPKEVGITWGETGLIYTGSSQAPTATPTGLVNGDTATITVTGGQTNVGSYTATASSISSSNYVLPTANTVTFTISFRISFACGEHGTGTIADALIQVNYYTITDSFTPETGYDFNGWSITSGTALLSGNELTNISDNLTITATWLIQSFTITWLMDDGSIINTTTVNYGVVPTLANPSKTQTDAYTYTFVGWNPEVVAATGVATYTATFSQTARKYPIHFVYDGIIKDFEFTLVSNFTFPQGSVFEGSHSYSVKKWTNDTLDNQEPNDSLPLTLSYNDVTFNAFTGGFYDEGTNRYYIEPTRDTFSQGMIKGLYKIKTYDGSSIKIHYFDKETGILHTDSSIYEFSGDNNYYKVENGYVNSTEGLSKDSNNDYYYTSDKNYLLKSGYHYLDIFNSIGDFKNGYYGFTSGKLTRVIVNNDATKLNKTYIDSNILYYDGIKVPYGLYKDTSNKLHYALYNGNLVNNGSVYIVSDKANGYNTYTNYLCKFKTYKMYNPYKKEDITYEG